MGLDVKVYRDVHKVVQNGTKCDFRAINYPEFKDRAKNLEAMAEYRGTGMPTRTISYPYSTHNDFRRQLAMLLNKSPDFWIGDVPSDAPFYELFDFADNEGYMDWECSENLYNDFVEYREVAEKILSKEWFEVYIEWTETFRLGKEVNNVVEFS